MKLYFENPTDNKFVQFEIEKNTLIREENNQQSLREHFENIEGLSAFLGAEIELLIQAGFSQALPLDERIPIPLDAQSYFDSSFFEALINAFGVEEKGISPSGAFSSLPKNLNTFLTFRETHQWGRFDFGKISFSDMGSEQISFESAILFDQNDRGSFRLLEHFMGARKIAQKGKDAYICIPHEYDAQRCEVWRFDTESMVPTDALASDLAVFLYAHHLIDESYYGVEEEQTKSRFEAIQNAFRGESFVEKMGIESRYISDSQDHIKYLFNRTYWIAHLLRNDIDLEIEDIANMFHVDIHTPQRWEKTKRFRFIRENPVTQLYWLWRLFWFDRKDELQECISLTKDSPSFFVESASKLIQEIEKGRKQVGTIEDIHALRKQWVALGLDPANSEQKLMEDAHDQKRIAADLEMAHSAIETLSDDELYKKAWSYTDNQNVLKVWLEHLRHASGLSKESLDRLTTQLYTDED